MSKNSSIINGSFETKMVFDVKNKATIITQDINGNGIVEVRQVITQSDKYKKIAVVYFDLDDDGDWDKLIIDYGYDGIIDLEDKIYDD